MPPIETRIVAERFNAWLARYSPPRNIAGNEQAMQDEADALLRVLLRRAPSHHVDLWIQRVCDLLDERATTRAWPPAGEVAKAAQEARQGLPAAEPQSSDAAPVGSHAWRLDVIARRIREGGPVGEDQVWGRTAVELLRTGRVTDADLERVRAAFVREWAAIGEEFARGRLAWRQAEHSKAEKAWEERQHEVARGPRHPREVAEIVARVLGAQGMEAAE